MEVKIKELKDINRIFEIRKLNLLKPIMFKVQGHFKNKSMPIVNYVDRDN